ncbi:unnamed protein product [Calypogeia fissa]
MEGTEEARGCDGAKWKKVLYGGVQAGYADNYTDTSFLEDMVMNANVRKRRTYTVMRDSIAISQHVCVVGLVGTVWTHALNGALDSWILLQLDALVLILGFIALVFTTEDIFSTSFLRRNVFNFSLFVAALYILAPIFQTLTRAISSDSIWTSTVCLLLVHLVFHDYTYTTMEPEAVDDDALLASPGTPQRSLQEIKQPAAATAVKRKAAKGITFSANVSLNASIVASVLIASRLPNRLIVFALMLCSLEFFLLFPLVTHCMRRRSMNFHLGFSCTLIVVTMVLIFPVSRLAFSLFVIVILFITVVCPYWLIKIQEYKFEINGPWDEAKLCFDVGD